VVGKIHQSLEGCACPMGVLTREFLKRLHLAENEVAVVDMEAGIEHFGRGIETSVDASVAVVEPSLESINLALHIQGLAEDSGAVFAGVVVNKVRDAVAEQTLRAKLDEEQLPVLAVVGHRPGIADVGLRGRALVGAGFADEVAAVVEAILKSGADVRGSG